MTIYYEDNDQRCALETDVSKRYFVFVFLSFYPYGGWNDLKGSFNDFEEAKEFAENFSVDGYDGDHWQIIDRETMRVVLCDEDA